MEERGYVDTLITNKSTGKPYKFKYKIIDPWPLYSSDENYEKDTIVYNVRCTAIIGKRDDDSLPFTTDMDYVAKYVTGEFMGNEYINFIEILNGIPDNDGPVEGVIECVGINVIKKKNDDDEKELSSDKWKYIFIFKKHGKSLAECVEEGKVFDECRIIEIIYDLSKTLHAVRNKGKGLYHLDVRPENVVYDYQLRTLRLIDFGVTTKYIATNNNKKTTKRALAMIAASLEKEKAIKNQKTVFQHLHPNVVGYWAPEYLFGETLDEKLHIYSIGFITAFLFGFEPSQVILNKRLTDEEQKIDANKLIDACINSKKRYFPPKASPVACNFIGNCIFVVQKLRWNMATLLDCSFLNQYKIMFPTPLCKDLKYKTDENYLEMYYYIEKTILPEMKRPNAQFGKKKIIPGLIKTLILKSKFSSNKMEMIGFHLDNKIICWAYGLCKWTDLTTTTKTKQVEHSLRRRQPYKDMVKHIGGCYHGIDYANDICDGCGDFHDPTIHCKFHYRLSIVRDEFICKAKLSGDFVKKFKDKYCNKQEEKLNYEIKVNDKNSVLKRNVEAKEDELLDIQSNVSSIVENIIIYHNILQDEYKIILEKTKDWSEKEINHCRIESFVELVSFEKYDLNKGKKHYEMKTLLDALKGAVKIKEICGYSNAIEHCFELKSFTSLRAEKILDDIHTLCCDICSFPFIKESKIWICVRQEKSAKCRKTCCQDCMNMYLQCHLLRLNGK
eukprot:435544_1